ncbi:MAG: ATP-binding cassette domain-containing protein [Coriobacteriia bacterium]|jgi:putative ABC transport system ATP-binding protein|nr:ATP-binding cassette domain-containing protein [Coriobacteriia bacterium]
MSVIIELKNVSKTFGSKQLFSSLNLAIEKGEFVSITGPSGVGKTTLLNIIALLEKSDSGDVIVCGKRNPRLGSRVASQLLRKEISYVFQNFGLIDDATVNENLDIAGHFLKMRRADKSELKESVLHLVGLPDILHEKVHYLSGGEQQRVALAKAIMKDSSIILADEPTGSLDDANRDGILAIFRHLNENGKTIVFVTHDQEVSRAASRQIALGIA